jgi:hypothetical protein
MPYASIFIKPEERQKYSLIISGITKWQPTLAVMGGADIIKDPQASFWSSGDSLYLVQNSGSLSAYIQQKLSS